MSRLRLLAPLRHREFRLLFGGQVISNVGDWLNLLALISLLLYRWDLGAPAWGAVLTALTLPHAVVGPVAGVWVDRWPRRTVMVASDLARAALVLGLVWAPNLATVLALVAAASVASVFFHPAQQAAVRATVPEADLLAANSLSQLSSNGARMLGPAVGGVLLAVGGPRTAFVVDALSFLASAALLLRLPALEPATAADVDGRERRFWQEMRTGMAHVLGCRPLLLAVGGMALAAFLFQGTDTMGALVLKALGVGEGLQGLAFTVLGIGYVVGAMAVGQWGQRFAPLGVMGAAKVGIGGVMALLGTAVALGVSGIGVTALAVSLARFLVGFGFAAMSATYGFLLQRETPPPLMGRVAASTRALIAAVPLAAPLVASLLTAWWGLGPTYAVFGVAITVVGGMMLAARRASPPATEPAFVQGVR